MRKTRIAVVDDQHLFRKGLMSLISEFDQLKVVVEAVNGKELIDKLVSRRPDVILLDLEMPVMDGVETTEYLRANFPFIKVLILTMHNEEGIIVHLVEKGAHGFLLKDDPIESIVGAIEAVLEQGYYFNDRVSKAMVLGLVEGKKIVPKFNQTLLSEREVEVVRLICKELTTKEIADKMCLSVRTIEGYRESIFEKIGARNLAGIVMYAVKNGIVS